nr:DNA phosphorothioation-dependent restriction protein DptG [Litorivivens lipolytica]
MKKNLTVGDNRITGYFPARTSLPKDGDFDWDIAKASIVKNLYRKKISDKLFKSFTGSMEEKEEYAIQAFRKICREDFIEALDDDGLWSHIDAMFFTKKNYEGLAPEALLFKLTALSQSSPQNRLADMFSGIMRGFCLKDIPSESNNFIEEKVLNSLRSDEIMENIQDGSKTLSRGINEKPYLPYITKYFTQDVSFLASHPKYFLAQLEPFLKFYAYIYTAQLALNIKNFREEPRARPLYFILDHETASKERTDLVTYGHRAVQDNLQYIFPYLSMSESLQEPSKENNVERVPLWILARNLSEKDTESLIEYAENFSRDRYEGTDFKFKYDKSNKDPHYWLESLLHESVSQFGRRRKRHAAREKFIKTTENELCRDFVKSRGQIGNVLVLNQDYISLITNISIGSKKKLRFGELLEEWKNRGIFFDKQSQKELLKFFERIGNVERMSDSGDAVYVFKTI